MNCAVFYCRVYQYTGAGIQCLAVKRKKKKMKLSFICPCHFGLESVLSGEVKRMGGENVTASDGKVAFDGGEELIARANLVLRTAERVLIKLGEFPARTFDELFEGTKALDFETFIGSADAFPVKGYSLNSQLKSVPDCQKIVKKAAVESLKRAYQVSWFDETGPVRQIRFSLFKDVATIMLDTSGVPLHKRGYRSQANEAPIKETLAAGMLDLARLFPDSTFCDPFCGSGTFVIEAVTKALNIAPGIKRTFAAEKWDCFAPSLFEQERARAFDLIRRDAPFVAFGMDIDEQSVELTRANAKKAGISARVRLKCAPISEFVLPKEKAVVVTNPPYGERMLEINQAQAIYKMMGERFTGDGRYYVISPDEEFERYFGKKATKRRKLYNGMLRCQYYMFY